MVKISRQRITLFLLLAFVLLTVQASLPQKAHAQSSVYVASLNQDIDPGAQDFVVSSINDATSSGIHNFILILNTNGGSGVNMENIISAISSYEGNGNNFTTLVAPTSAHAFSAGAYIAESSDNIFMVPGTVIGAATPIVSGIPTGEENSTLSKDIGAFKAYMITLTGSHHRNATAAALMVTPPAQTYDCQTYNSCAAQRLGVINRVLNANNTQQALTLLGAGDATIHTPGTASIFLFLELKTHHGVSAIAGVIIFIVGFLLIFSLPSSTPAPASAPSGSGTFIQISVLTYTILGIVGGGGVLGSIYLYRVRETLMHRPPAQNPKAIIGKTGRLTSDLKAGEVATANIGAEDFTVTGSSDLASGTLVRVKDLQGLRLIVEKMEN